MNEWRARMLLRASILSGLVLSAITLASVARWFTIEGWQSLAMAIGFAATGLCGWVSRRWLQKRQLAL